MWTGNCPNCGEPHGSAALKPGMSLLCLTCMTPFKVPPTTERGTHMAQPPAKHGQELLWDDDDRDQT